MKEEPKSTQESPALAVWRRHDGTAPSKSLARIFNDEAQRLTRELPGWAQVNIFLFVDADNRAIYANEANLLGGMEDGFNKKPFGKALAQNLEVEAARHTSFQRIPSSLTKSTINVISVSEKQINGISYSCPLELALDHEIGHMLIPYGPEDMNGNGHEIAADVYAHIRATQRGLALSGGIGTAEANALNLLAANNEHLAFDSDNKSAHYTNKGLRALARYAENHNLATLGSFEAIALADAIARQTETTGGALQRIMHSFADTRKDEKPPIQQGRMTLETLVDTVTAYGRQILDNPAYPEEVYFIAQSLFKTVDVFAPSGTAGHDRDYKNLRAAIDEKAIALERAEAQAIKIDLSLIDAEVKREYITPAPAKPKAP